VHKWGQMWPFTQKPASPDLRERLEVLERSFKSLRLEWDETYDRVSRLMGRIAKRAALDQKRAEEASDVDPGSTNGPPPDVDDFSKQVLALRRHR
jgi:hypothetical protein